MAALIFLAVYVYLAVTTGYLLILALAGRWGKTLKYNCNAVKKNIVVVIPAYKEDIIIVETVQQALAHNYPHSCFTVLVIADTLQEETLQQLRNLPVQVLQVAFDISTKAKSLHAALHVLPHNFYDIAVILDADNIMADDCLEKINDAFCKGSKAVQCHRIAKNSSNAIALLDAISGEINTNLFRRGPAALGLSAAPAGSGMAIDYMLLGQIYSQARVLYTTAEDREVDVQLMKAKVPVVYIDDAYVYDEKVADRHAFKKQRTRWLEAQLRHCLRFFEKDMKSAPRTADYYNKFFQTLLLPRLLYLLVFGIIVVLLCIKKAFGFPVFYPRPLLWIALVAVYCIVLLVSIPLHYYTRKTLYAVASIPVLMAAMVAALLGMKKNRKEFLHTSKTITVNKPGNTS